jgi:hypothetical protein
MIMPRLYPRYKLLAIIAAERARVGSSLRL